MTPFVPPGECGEVHFLDFSALIAPGQAAAPTRLPWVQPTKKRAAYPKATQIPYDPKFSNIKSLTFTENDSTHGERLYAFRTFLHMENVSIHSERFY